MSKAAERVWGTVESANRVLDQVPDTRILVSTSGKDSFAVLDLAVKRYGSRNVVAFFKAMVPGIRCELSPVERVCRQLNVELITTAHETLPRILKAGGFGPVPMGAGRMRSLTARDVENAMRDRTGISFVAGGHRETEGLSRLAWLRPCQGVELQHRRVSPIWNWRTQAVYAYLKHVGINPPDQIGTHRPGKNSGLSPEIHEAMAWLRDRGGEDWARWLQVFPFSGMSAMKWDKQRALSSEAERRGDRPRRPRVQAP